MQLLRDRNEATAPAQMAAGKLAVKGRSRRMSELRGRLCSGPVLPEPPRTSAKRRRG
jgi:hypothetical protein